jgi:hypothetical protein
MYVAEKPKFTWHRVEKPPNPPFMPPLSKPMEVPRGMFWYGDEGLWTLLGVDGVWSGSSSADCNGYCTKLTYWGRNFDSRTEPKPKLIVTAHQLDQEAPVVVGSQAYPVFVGGPIQAAMMTMIDIPRSGCWEIVAKYRDEKLSFVQSVRVPRVKR